MKRLRIYVDTSVLGGCFDPEFSTWSNALMRDFRAARLAPVLSEVTATEVSEAPPAVRTLHEELVSLAEPLLTLTPEAHDLAAAYAARRILGDRYAADMRHIALATIAGVNALVSWNFRHIVRFDKIRLFNAVSVEWGYGILNILSPREVTSHENS